MNWFSVLEGFEKRGYKWGLKGHFLSFRINFPVIGIHIQRGLRLEVQFFNSQTYAFHLKTTPFFSAISSPLLPSNKKFITKKLKHYTNLWPVFWDRPNRLPSFTVPNLVAHKTRKAKIFIAPLWIFAVRWPCPVKNLARVWRSEVGVCSRKLLFKKFGWSFRLIFWDWFVFDTLT